MKQHPWQTLQGLPRSSWALAAATLVNRAGTMVMPFLALYLTRELGFSFQFAGALFTVYGIGALGGGPVAGRLCDRFGSVPVLVGCLVSSGTVLLVMPLATTRPTMAVAVLAFAVTSEGVRPAVMTVAGALVPPARLKSAFVLNRLSVNLGMSIGPALGGILSSIGFRYLFWVDGATSILAGGLLLLTVPLSATPPAVRSTEEHRAGRRSSFRDRRFVRFLAGVVFVGLVFFQLEGAMPLYTVDDLGIAPRTLGFMFTINTGMIIVLEVPINGATERWSHAKSLAVGALLVGFGFGGFALARGGVGVALCIVVLTFGEMILFPALSAFVADASPEGRTGEYMGVYSMAFSLAYAIGPGLGVQTLARVGPTVLWLGAFALSFAATALLAWAGKTPPERRPPLKLT